jgi:glycerol uptake facilitator-like aquaporin
LSPAISFAMFLLGRMTLIRFLVYCLAQIVGAFIAALLVYVLYLDMLQTYGDRMYSLDTAGIFATYPNKNLSSFGGFFDQTVGTAILGILFILLWSAY